MFGAVAASFGVSGLAGWVPVVTTVATSLLAHISASRYDHQIVEYLCTAQRLLHLRDFRIADQMPDGEFIDACEAAISVENQGWMASWQATDNEN